MHCRKCGMEGEFSPGRLTCKACCSFVKSAWYYRNQRRLRKRNRLYARQWRAQHPGYNPRKTPQPYNAEAQRKYRAKYRSKPGIREQENEQSRRYYAANRDRILRQKKLAKIQRAVDRGFIGK